MAQLVSDTLKQRGNGDFPIVNAKDVALENGMSVEDSIYEEVHVGEEPPTDERTKLWIDDSSNFAEDKLDVLADYNEYSDEEICIGQYLGKPLYRRVIVSTMPNCTTSGTEVTKNIDANWSLDTLVDLRGTTLNSRERWLVDQMISSNVNTHFRLLYNNSTKQIAIMSSEESLNNQPVYVVIEYTKTTDEADSFHPSMIKTFPSAKRMVVADFDDYSTDEIVIGRWIDGRPIYRKCFFGKSPSTTSDSAIGYVPTDADLVTNLDGFIIVSSGRLPINWYGGGTYNTITQVRYDHANRPIELRLSYSGWCNLPCYCWIEYTKTTDSPNSFDPNMLSTATMKYDATDDEVAEVLG